MKIGKARPGVFPRVVGIGRNGEQHWAKAIRAKSLRGVGQNVTTLRYPVPRLP